MKIVQIGKETITVAQLAKLSTEDHQLKLSDKAVQAINHCREYLDNKIRSGNEAIYGINTGFGYLQNVKVNASDLEQLQHNLLLSHACGTGELVPLPIVKLMLLLKIQSLAYGHSGVSIETVERLVEMYNQNALPVIKTQGSLGASGDLAPLAHLALP